MSKQIIRLQDKNNCFQLIIHYKNHKIRYSIPLNRDLWLNDMISTLKWKIKEHFQINSNIILCEDKYGDLEIDDIDDLKIGFGAMNFNKINSHIRMDLYVKISQQKHDLSIDRSISNCVSPKIDEILQFHSTALIKIFAKKKSYINEIYIESKSFKNVMQCLNKIRPKLEEDYKYLSYDIKRKIQFWQKYAYLCLIRQNIRKCIKLKIGITRQLFETNKFCQDLFVKQYIKLRNMIELYHGLNQNDDQLLFDCLLIQCSEIKIDVPVKMMTDDYVLTDVHIQSKSMSKAELENVVTAYKQKNEALEAENAELREICQPLHETLMEEFTEGSDRLYESQEGNIEHLETKRFKKNRKLMKIMDLNEVENEKSMKAEYYQKQNEELQMKLDGLQRNLDLLQCKPQQLDTLSLDELNELKIIMQHRVKLIEKAEKRLMDNKYKCVASMDRSRESVFLGYMESM